MHSTKVHPLLCRKLHYGEVILILPSASRSLRNSHVLLLVKFSHFEVIAEGFFCTNTIL